MRREAWTVVAILLVGAAILTFWPYYSDMEPSPPGQYPLHVARFEWPATERIKRYQPSRSMGSDAVQHRDARDAKARCGIDNTCPTALSF